MASRRVGRVAATVAPVVLVAAGPAASIDNAPRPSAAAYVDQLTVTPESPAPGEPVTVSALLPPGATATLTYKVMFDAKTTLPFRDDAASPGGAGDGVYAATIPGHAAGRLVRYRVDGSAPGVPIAEPSAEDSIRFHGYVVRDPSVASELPVVEWFMADAVYKDLLENHRYDDVEGDAVWAYDGRVWDRVRMRVRGNTSRRALKVNWKVEFPKGHAFDLGGRLPYPLDEFALQSYRDNLADVGWDTVRRAGARSLAIVPVRTQRNGAFWSLGRIMETEDGEWRADQGVEDWAIYKADGGALTRTRSPARLRAKNWLDKKTREQEGYRDVWRLTDTVDRPKSAKQRSWLHRNANVPAMINYMAINSLIRHQDSGWFNWWVARDTAGTKRWELWHWDLDWIFTTPAADGKGLFLTPDSGNRFVRAMLNYPEFRAMFYRRLRTLSDRFLAPGAYETQWDAITARTVADWSLDHERWGGITPAASRHAFVAGLADRRNTFDANTPALVPLPQSPTASAVINEVHYRPARGGVEFIELANPNATATDISGWSIPAVDLTIQPGTVIPAGAYVVFVADDVGFRAAYPTGRRFVGGEYDGALANSGETVELWDSGRLVDTVTYSPATPWPVAANGGGPSLELTRVDADNALPGSWRASSTTGGTPGGANT